ncbi:MAG: formylglycine-generating enzyme family protein [Planctomycetota bacterium]|jgi:formylglycine-generating enzyme required for sulfatase activity
MRQVVPPKASFYLSTVLGLGLCLSAPAQSNSNGEAGANGATSNAIVSKPKDEIAFPAGMIRIPKGKVQLGTDAKDYIKELSAIGRTPRAQINDMRRCMSELGEATTEVEAFYLGEHPVTMEQYKIFVDETGHRFPFDWWRFGREDSFREHLKKINEEMKDVEGAKAQFYWQVHWKELPYAIPESKNSSAKGSMDQFPVTYVSWDDAVAFAAWAGMRLPKEAEWVYAASGQDRRNYVWGDNLEDIPIKRGSRFDRPWPVGHWKDEATGPFGNRDMVLGVYEWMGDSGFFSLVDTKEFEKQRKALLKNKLFKDKENRDVKAILNYRPKWSGTVKVTKGGDYGGEGAVLRIQTRVPQEAYQVRERLGFRLAKSDVPARDIVYSRIALDYDLTVFSGNRKPNINDQVGMERYELAEDGRLITGYHAVSLVPTSYAGDSKKMNEAKWNEKATGAPQPIATLMTTEVLSTPPAQPGLYTIYFRHLGMPEELVKALADGNKELVAEEKAKEAAKKGRKPSNKKKDEEEQDSKSKGKWRTVTKKYGITDKEVLGGEVNFVRIKPGDLKVYTDRHQYLLRNNEGQFTSAWDGDKGIVKSKYEDGNSTVGLATVEGVEGEVATFTMGVPQFEDSKGKVYTYVVPITLPPESAAGSSWRTK